MAILEDSSMCRLLLIALAIIMLSVTPLVAQEREPRFMIGPTGGINLSAMIFSPKVYQGLKLGYDAGIIIRYDSGVLFPELEHITGGLFLEVDYSSRGWKEVPSKNRDLPAEYDQYSYDRTLNFINVPIMTHLMFGKGALKFTVSLGSHFGYLLSESSQSNFPEEKLPGVVVAQHNMPVENKFAWGIGGGVGLEYHKGRTVAGIRGSYVYGLGEIYGNMRSDYFGKSSEQIIATKLYFLFAF